MTSNVGRSFQFRNEVLLYLHAQGLISAASALDHLGPHGKPTGLTHGDISGIPGWTIGVRNQQGLDLSTAQNEVAAEAALDANSLFCSIQKHHGSPVSDAYVTLPLHVMLRVLAQLHPDLLRSLPAPAMAGSG